MGTLKIERTGGFAGFGLPNANIKSSGEQSMSALSAADQARVEELFKNPAAHQGSGQQSDSFNYRITRSVGGKAQTVTVHESAVPEALQKSVTDKLK
jgi:hypothetical protein